MATITALLQHKVKKSSKKPLRWLRKAALTEQSIVSGPYGDKEAFPCDYRSSGGSLRIIEKHIEEAIDPHVEEETIRAQKILTNYREEARSYIHKSTNCSPEHLVLFTDSNFADTVSTYFNAIDIVQVASNSDRAPVICIGHDLFNELQNVVRKFGGDPMEIQMTNQGLYDRKQLDAFLKFYQRQGRMLMGVFSVGDEVSGVLQDTTAITGILRYYGALSLWDYRSTGAYIKINMCPLVSYEGLTNKDAAFIQTSRFLGGKGGANVLITNSTLLRNSIFETSLEGILAFSTINGVLDRSVSPHSTIESLTPFVKRRLVASTLQTRAVFELKGYFGECFLQKKTAEISELLIAHLRHIPSLHVVGGVSPSTKINTTESGHHPLPYFSLFFSHPQTEWALHPEFVLALLRDLFGIIASIFPVSLRLLPSTPKLEYQCIMHSLLTNPEVASTIKEPIMSVSCVHLSLMHFMRDIDLEYLVAAIKIIAEEGWRLLPYYNFDVESGKWSSVRPVGNRSEMFAKTITKIWPIQVTTQSVKYRHVVYIERAKKLLSSINSKSVKKLEKEGHSSQDDDQLSALAKGYRWFMTPADAVDSLDEASPVRLATRVDSSNKKKMRTWPGTTSTSSHTPSFRIANASYKRRFGHV
eukprot:g3245.t1